MKAFFAKIGEWIKKHIWQSVAIGIAVVAVITTAIVLPITLNKKHVHNPSANVVNATEFAEALDFNTLKNFKGHHAYYGFDLVNPNSQYGFEQDGNVAKMIFSSEDQYIEYKDEEYFWYYYSGSYWVKTGAEDYQWLISDFIISWKGTLEYSDFTYNSESKTYICSMPNYEFKLKFDLLGGKKRLVSFDVVVNGYERYLYEFSSYGDASLVLPEIDEK